MIQIHGGAHSKLEISFDWAVIYYISRVYYKWRYLADASESNTYAGGHITP
jgi:uncharacterized MAPEG superfamily protein